MTNRLLTLTQLRAQARATTLGLPSTLADALQRLGCVQADPIRAPVRAQDLILRQRVRGYRVGDLDRAFQRLGLEEDFLYAYGIMPAETRHLLHPRPDPGDKAGVHRPDPLAASDAGPRAGRRLDPSVGSGSALWPGSCHQWLGWLLQGDHAGAGKPAHYGLLRITRRQDGIRIYAAPLPFSGPWSARATRCCSWLGSWRRSPCRAWAAR
jgi:hypothetical protein